MIKKNYYIYLYSLIKYQYFEIKNPAKGEFLESFLIKLFLLINSISVLQNLVQS